MTASTSPARSRLLPRRPAGLLRAAKRAIRPLLQLVPRTPTALVGTVWLGGDTEPTSGALLLDRRGRIEQLLPSTDSLPQGTRVVGGTSCWVGPALIDTHVHLAFGGPLEMARTGLLTVRDLGTPFDRLARLQSTSRSAGVAATFSGPIITAVDGYPTTTWGADGFGMPVPSEEYAAPAVEKLAERSCRVVKVALESGDGQPALPPGVLRVVVRRAHELGLPVVAHALTEKMVQRALDADVDELAHMPTELLSTETIERLADRNVPVSSTLQTIFAEGLGAEAARNARAMVRAGVPLMYGTDLGNTATSPGVDPRELDRLAQAGLGRLGALRAATSGAARAGGLDGVGSGGVLRVGDVANAVVLGEDPLVEPATWRRPFAVFSGGRRCDDDSA